MYVLYTSDVFQATKEQQGLMDAVEGIAEDVKLAEILEVGGGGGVCEYSLCRRCVRSTYA